MVRSLADRTFQPRRYLLHHADLLHKQSAGVAAPPLSLELLHRHDEDLRQPETTNESAGADGGSLPRRRSRTNSLARVADLDAAANRHASATIGRVPADAALGGAAPDRDLAARMAAL